MKPSAERVSYEPSVLTPPPTQASQKTFKCGHPIEKTRSGVWGTGTLADIDTLAVLETIRPTVEPNKMIAAAISGSHAWGLATPESDIDVRGIYAWPLQRAVAMYTGSDTIERVGLGESANVDSQFYEAKKACHMLASSNGNLVQLLLSPAQISLTTAGGELRDIADNLYKTKRLAEYYRGYATSQRKRAAQNRGGKALVYTYREIFVGVLLMRLGSIVWDFRVAWRLMEESGHHSDLLHRIFVRPKWAVVDAVEMDEFDAEWDVLVSLLNSAVLTSSLPDRPPHDHNDLADWLERQRMGGVGK